MDPRKSHILRAIIEKFIETAEPVGSEAIIVSYHLEISPATVRLEMSKLEKEGLIEQPHTSAGRVPTELGYRMYLEKLADYEKAKKYAKEYLQNIHQEHEKEKIKQRVFDAVSILARATDNICFATIPNNDRTFYLGISNILRKPEFQKNPEKASQVIEILEQDHHFIDILKNADIDDSIKIFIGEENLIKEITSCSIIVTKYSLGDFEGFIGILGPKRMNYPFNAVILEEVRDMID